MSALLHVGLLTSDLSHRHGWGSYSLSLAEALLALDVRLTIVAARNSPDAAGFDAMPLLPAVEPRDSRWLLRLAAALPKARAALHECEVIHSTIEPYAPLAGWIAGRRPVVVTGHGSYVQAHRAWRAPVDWLYARAFRRGLMVCVSRYTARAAERDVPGVRTTVVNNGVDAARFANLPPLDAPKRGPTVLTVGAVKARKGTLELVRAVAKVREAVPDVQCVILGSLTAEPGYVQRVRAEIDALGLGHCVHLPGYVPEPTMMGWYGAADLFVLPSMNDGWKFEGYGLALVEASAAGLPVIGTRDCGAEDAVEDGVTGLLVPQERIDEALPQAMIRLLRDRTLATQMAAAGRARAAAQTWTGVARQMAALYRRELETAD